MDTLQPLPVQYWHSPIQESIRTPLHQNGDLLIRQVRRSPVGHRAWRLLNDLPFLFFQDNNRIKCSMRSPEFLFVVLQEAPVVPLSFFERLPALIQQK